MQGLSINDLMLLASFNPNILNKYFNLTRPITFDVTNGNGSTGIYTNPNGDYNRGKVIGIYNTDTSEMRFKAPNDEFKSIIPKTNRYVISFRLMAGDLNANIDFVFFGTVYFSK